MPNPDHIDIAPSELSRVEAIASQFDRMRDCGWNFAHLRPDRSSPILCAVEVPQYASLGRQCYGTLDELALLHTLRPCKDCGNDTLFFSNTTVSCCNCLGESETCDDCQNGGCRTFAVNGNLRDAITRWSIRCGDDGARGRVTAIG